MGRFTNTRSRPSRLLCVPTSTLNSIVGAVDEIYDRAWDWFLTSSERKAAFCLTPEIEAAFGAAMGCGAPTGTGQSPFAALCPVKVKVIKHLSSRYTAVAVSAANDWAAECLHRVVFGECRLDALAWQLGQRVQMVEPGIFVPLSLVKAILGAGGRTIRSIERHVKTTLHVLPIGDTAGTHAIFVSRSFTLSRKNTEAVRRIVSNILSRQWVAVTSREMYAYDWYRVRKNGTVVAHGGPLMCVFFGKTQIAMRDHEGRRFFFDRAVDTIEAFAL